MTATEPRRELADTRTVGPDENLRVARARSRSRPRRAAAASSTAPIWPARLARPDMRERDAERRRRGGQADRSPSAGGSARRPRSVDGHLGPGDELLDDQRRRCATRRARAIASASSSAERDEREPALTLAVGRLDHAGEADALGRPRRRSAPTDLVRRLRNTRLAKRSRWRSLEVESVAVSRRDRMRQREPLRTVRRSPPASRSRRDQPVDALGAGEPLDARLVLGREDRAPVGVAEPGADGSRSSAITMQLTRPRCGEQAELRRARRLGRGDVCPVSLRGSPATTPHSRGTTRWCARALPRTTCAPASRVRRSVLSVEPMCRSTWPGRSRTCAFSDDGLPSVSSTVSAMSVTEMSMPVATLITSPMTCSSGRDDRLDRLGVVVHVEPVAARMPVAVDRQQLVLQRLRDEARDHLLRMLARPVVVEGPDDHDREAVRDVVRVRKPVGARLRRRVRAAGVERMLLVHGRVVARCRRPRSRRRG